MCCAFSLRLPQQLRPGWEGSSRTTPEIDFDYFDGHFDYSIIMMIILILIILMITIMMMNSRQVRRLLGNSRTTPDNQVDAESS